MNIKVDNQSDIISDLLITVVPREHLEHHLILPKSVEVKLQRIQKEWTIRGKLGHYGLINSNKILIYGSPGCGKSKSVESLAWNTGLQLIRINMSLISYIDLESSLNKICKVIKDIKGSPYPLILLDDFNFYNDHSNNEKKNDILKLLLDLYSQCNFTHGLLAATTNNISPINSSVKLRFDNVINILPPTKTEIKAILKQSLCGGVPLGIINWDSIAKEMVGLNVIEIKKTAQMVAKQVILNQQELITEEVLKEYIEEHCLD